MASATQQRPSLASAAIALATLLGACTGGGSSVGVSGASYTVGGTVSGLAGTVVLDLNGSGDLSVPSDGPFAFPDPVPDGGAYDVTVLTQPAGEMCTVGSGLGTVAGANVTNLSVVCSATTFTVGGAVSGLAGTVVLQANGADNLSVSANGPFSFPKPLADGGEYKVTVLTQPAGEVCSVGDDSGVLAGANISDVDVVCSAALFSVGGTVSGLAGTVTLQLNGAGNLNVSASGPFTFPGGLPGGGAYAVSVLRQPAGQTCAVGSGSGTIVGANVANVSIFCSATLYSVGGTVSGLAGAVTLRLNGSVDLGVSANGAFAFPGPLPTGGAYSVAVLRQPAGQSCAVANGTGTITGGNVTSVSVVCSAVLYSVGGTVSGLVGTVVLQVNGGANLSISANGPFVFSQRLPDGGAYKVTVLKQPAGQSCAVANASGTLAGANVASVSVVCSALLFSVGGTVSGLAGTVVLQLNGAANISVSANGPFNIPQPVPDGGAYSVTVLTQPAGQSCAVGNGSGTIAGANVANVSVVCSAVTYTVGGTVSGLAGNVVLRLNGSVDVGLSADGPFTFPGSFPTGGAYAVTVLAQPAGEICEAVNGSGTIAGANVTSVSIVCSASTFTVGGTVSGLVGTVLLQLNGAANVSVSANGAFNIPQPLPDGGAYSVTVLAQPAGQACAVGNGSGTIAGANVTNVSVVCLSLTYTVGGSVSGLSGTVVLQLNGGVNLSLAANGPFAFPAPLPNGSTYAVKVLSQPAGQNCSIGNGSGTLAGANIANVTVACRVTAFTVGGNISGLAGTLTLRVNAGAPFSVSANGPFTAPGILSDGTAYSVTVVTPPAGETCTVGNGHGKVAGANVTSVSIVCAPPPTFTVGGTLSGLAGTIVLQNDEDLLTLTTDGPFTFHDDEAQGALYSVTVLTQPAGQHCFVSNASGAIAGANVTNVTVTCVAQLVFFAADDGAAGLELWKSDGTTTVRVKDINPGPNGSQPHGFTPFNGALYFAATDGVSGFELWKTDGSNAGTVLVKDINTGPGDSNPEGFTVFNGALYFSADDGDSGIELWKSDGTTAGTVRVKDINPGLNGSRPQGFTEFDGALYFSADDGVTGTELWRTDGSGAGTALVKDIDLGTGDSNPAGFAVFDGELYFSADNGPGGVELWKTDGTDAGTMLVKEINPKGGSNPTQFMVFNGALFFSANDGDTGFELWKTDGTGEGTVLVKDIRPGKQASRPTGLIVFNGALFFSATDGISGFELWRSDGTGAGTVAVHIDAGRGSSLPGGFTELNGFMYFSADDGTNGNELWKTDGTDTGTVLVKDIKPGGPNSNPGEFAAINGTLFFRADDGATGTELWKSDGTATGTVQVQDIKPGAGDSNPAGLTPF